MNILITGADGFVGKNLTAALKNIRDGKNRTHPELCIDELYLYDIDTPEEVLEEGCERADFVFNLAGVNRPKAEDEFMQGNFGFASRLLDMLKRHENTCPVMLSSSTQASLLGRFEGSVYGESKRAGEELFFEYGRQTGARVLVYRFPNIFGKWCRPNYNSAVATFCHNIANGLDITVNDPTVELELVYIDDLVEEMLLALSGRQHACEFSGADFVLADDGRYCAVPVTHRVLLGDIVAMLREFEAQPDTLLMPEISKGSLKKKLYSTYLSYLPEDRVKFPLKMNTDARGSFTELLKTQKCGQFSVNISRPGITKGQHWHDSKWELFIVVSGHALIRQRKIGTEEVLSLEVSGKKIEAVHMLPGYTHSITNLSEAEELVTLMWANEQLDPERPDTFSETV